MKIDVDDIRGRIQTFGTFIMDGDEAIALLALIDAAVAWETADIYSGNYEPRQQALHEAVLPFMPEAPK